MSTLIISCVLLIVIIFLLIAAFNLIVDPYGLYYIINSKGFNTIKPAILKYKRGRVHRAYAIQRICPKTIVLGSSRAANLNNGHPSWRFKPVYNVSLPGAGIHETMYYFQYAHAVTPLRQIVLFIDFFLFNIYLNSYFDLNDRILAIIAQSQHINKFNHDVIYDALFSWNAVNASVNTIQRNRSKFLLRTAQTSTPNRNCLHSKFLERENIFINNKWRFKNYEIIDPETSVSTYNYYRTILKICHCDHIDMRVLISPIHARLCEVIIASGLWQKFEEWKRMLVNINEEEASQVGAQSFPLWDFSGYNSITTEPVPLLSDCDSKMLWYNDPSHFNRKLGDIILDRIFGHVNPNRSAPDDFGVLITSENIEQHIEKICNDRSKYAASHSDNIAEIRQMVNK